MNWFMVAVSVMQYSAAGYGFYIGQSWRVNVMNICVATANLFLAGA